MKSQIKKKNGLISYLLRFHRKCLICPKHASYIPRFPSLDMRGLHAPSAAQNQNKIPFPTIPGRGWGRGGTVDARGRRRHFEAASTSSSGHSLRHPPSTTSRSPSIPPLMSPNSSLDVLFTTTLPPSNLRWTANGTGLLRGLHICRWNQNYWLPRLEGASKTPPAPSRERAQA